jgi:hypothetical protein
MVRTMILTGLQSRWAMALAFLAGVIAMALLARNAWPGSTVQAGNDDSFCPPAVPENGLLVKCWISTACPGGKAFTIENTREIFKEVALEEQI